MNLKSSWTIYYYLNLPLLRKRIYHFSLCLVTIDFLFIARSFPITNFDLSWENNYKNFPPGSNKKQINYIDDFKTSALLKMVR